MNSDAVPRIPRTDTFPSPSLEQARILALGPLPTSPSAHQRETCLRNRWAARPMPELGGFGRARTGLHEANQSHSNADAIPMDLR